MPRRIEAVRGASVETFLANEIPEPGDPNLIAG